MICSNCSFHLTPGAGFCSNCGSMLPNLGEHAQKSNLASIIMKAISIPLAAYFVTVLPWVIMASDEPFSFLGRVNEFLPYLATGAVLLYITAHCIDLNYLRLKSGVLPWIFELFGAILFVPVGILLIIALNDMSHNFNDTYWVVVASLESAALLLIAIAKLISGIRSRKA